MSNDMRYNPFAQLQALQQQFFGDDFFTPFTGVNVPTTDVYEKDGALVVEAHLPNFSQDNVNIEVDNGVLVIRAERHEKDEDKTKKYVVRESSSSFYRRIQLPDRADADHIKAHLDEGVLKVEVPLSPLPAPKKIAVGAKSKSKK